MTSEEVTANAKQLASEITADARNTEGPVVWVTGNSYMPPMRSFSAAEEVYQLADWGLWELFCDTVDSELSNADVYMASPDYDNALYIVDLKRWEYTETPNPYFNADDLNSEWKRHE
jgi:hypothetical protein